ncbi:MAG: hypothetical protein ACFFG0_08260 [Candidatus Thorarchaeota archaeon]
MKIIPYINKLREHGRIDHPEVKKLFDYYAKDDSEFVKRAIKANKLFAAFQLEKVIRKRLEEITELINRGKGTWPKKNYVRDDIWNLWKGEKFALEMILRDVGLEL